VGTAVYPEHNRFATAAKVFLADAKRADDCYISVRI
jgi:hypothetical protein